MTPDSTPGVCNIYLAPRITLVMRSTRVEKQKMVSYGVSDVQTDQEPQQF